MDEFGVEEIVSICYLTRGGCSKVEEEAHGIIYELGGICGHT